MELRIVLGQGTGRMHILLPRDKAARSLRINDTEWI